MVGRLKKVSAVLLTLLMLAFLPSCGDKTTANLLNKSQVPQVTINFMSCWGGSSPYRELVEDTIAEFMSKNPDIRIVNESLSQGAYLSKLKTNFATGYVPDVFVLWPGVDLKSLVTSGKVANLRVIMDPDWESKFTPNALNTYVSNYGGLYGLPFDTAFAGMYVNLDILSENGIEVPRTYDELLSAVEILHGNNTIPIAYSVDLEGSMLYQAIVAGLSKDQKEIRSNDVHIEAMKVLKELYDRNAFPDNAFIMSGYEQNKLFLDGKAAMMVQGSWFSGDLKGMEEQMDIVPFPVFGSDPSQYTLTGQNGYNAFHVSKNAFLDDQMREAIKRFLVYFTSDKVAYNFIENKGMLSSLNLFDQAYLTNIYAKKSLKLVQNANAFFTFPSSYLSEQSWHDTFINQIPYLLEDRITPSAIMADVVFTYPSY
jgi:raffinose/stachyose/melibiose transport system substrate-binding protein